MQARPEIGILESLRGIWEDKREDNWELFDNEEITRYICGKIALDEAGFLTDRTKDNLRSLYRLIAERIRQYQNITAKSDIDRAPKAKM